MTPEFEPSGPDGGNRPSIPNPNLPPGINQGGSGIDPATGKPIAVVVSGLGDNKPNDIIKDLESRGYLVMYFTWHNLGALPPVEKISLALGHSAGAARVELEYGNNKSDVRVISLDSPTRFGNPDVVEYYSNTLDPVSQLGILIDTGRPGKGEFSNLSRNPHNKNDAYDKVEWNE